MLKNILYIGLFTMIMVFIWVGFNIYHSNSTSTIEEPTSIRINPITASFNTKTLDNLKSRKNIPIDLKEALKLATPTAVISPTIVPTEPPINLVSPGGISASESGGQQNQTIPGSGSGNMNTIL